MKTAHLTHAQFAAVFAEALDFSGVSDPDAFASDAALSAIFCPDPDDPPTEEETVAVFEDCRKVYEYARLTVPDLKHQYGMTTAQLAERFCIPTRTLENWCTGDRTPPQYVLLMMATILERECPKQCGKYHVIVKETGEIVVSAGTLKEAKMLLRLHEDTDKVCDRYEPDYYAVTQDGE